MIADLHERFRYAARLTARPTSILVIKERSIVLIYVSAAADPNSSLSPILSSLLALQNAQESETLFKISIL